MMNDNEEKKELGRRQQHREEEKKKKGAGGIIYKVIMGLLVAVMIFSGYKVATIYMGYQKATAAYNKIAKEVVEEEPTEDGRMKVNWEALIAEGPDVKAWILCEDTPINYPVVQAWDNDYYLHRMIDGTWEDKGTPFIDFRIENPFKDFQTVIYGHRMYDKSMFGVLGDYFTDSSYYSKHPVLQLYTPSGNYDLEVFGGAQVDATDEETYRFVFYGEEDKANYISRIHYMNQILGYDQRVGVSAGDRIVMLSTCSHLNEDKRFVVWCKMTQVGSVEETKEALTGGSN